MTTARGYMNVAFMAEVESIIGGEGIVVGVGGGGSGSDEEDDAWDDKKSSAEVGDVGFG